MGGRIAAGFLVVLVWILAPFVVAGLWGRDRILDTDGWVELAARLPEEPDAREAVGAEIAEVILDGLDLRPRARDRAQPVVRELTDAALRSDAVAVVWTEANRSVHASLVRVLEGGETDDVRLDLRPVVAVTLDRVEEPIAAVAPLPGEVPELGATPTPQEAQAAIETALGRPLAPERATVVVLRGDRLATARSVYRGIDRWTFALAVVTVLLAAAAIALGRDRWKTVAALGIGSGVTLLLGWIAAQGVGSVAGSFLGEGVGRVVAEAAAGVAANDLGGRYVTAAIALGLAGVAAWIVGAVLARRT